MLLPCTDLNLNITEKQTYSFAASNSGNGFINYFTKVFNPSLFRQIFIIKGGPGTGKSRFMQYIAKQASESGCAVEYILCSSDPNSLDGIILHPDGNLQSDLHLFALLDGTAPHCIDSTLPGACENIINLGEFWNSDVLYQKRDLLEHLNRTKKEEYESCYRYLKAAEEIDNDIFHLRKCAILYPKLEAASERLADKMSEKSIISAPKVTYRLNRAISMSGCVDTCTFEKSAETNYCICGDDEVSQEFMFCLYQNLKKHGQYLQISTTPLSENRIDGLYLPQRSVSIVAYTKAEESEKNKKKHVINANRFVDREVQASIRQRSRFAVKCRNSMLLGAETALEKIRQTHFAIEEIYVSAMNFKELERYRKKKCDEILKNMICR